MNGDESHWPSCPFPLIDVDREGLREGEEAAERVWFFDLASPTRLIFLAYRSSWSLFLRERRRGEADGEQDRWIKFLNGIFAGLFDFDRVLFSFFFFSDLK